MLNFIEVLVIIGILIFYIILYSQGKINWKLSLLGIYVLIVYNNIQNYILLKNHTLDPANSSDAVFKINVIASRILLVLFPVILIIIFVFNK